MKKISTKNIFTAAFAAMVIALSCSTAYADSNVDASAYAPETAESLDAAEIESANIETEEFTIYSYCPKTGEERYIECDTSFVTNLINNGVTDVTTQSCLGKEIVEQGNLGSEISPNIIIGSDSRYQITNTTIAPYRSICLVETCWKDGSISRSTGCLVGSDILLTSATLAYNLNYGGQAKFINVYPGLNGDNQVYGQVIAKSVYVTADWKYTAPSSDNWALIKLQNLNGGTTTVGDVTGYFGLNYSVTGNLDGTTVSVTGYPSDKAVGLNYTMWRSNGKVTGTETSFLDYDCDIMGETGAPVLNSSNKIVAIHSGSLNGENFGVKVTPQLLSTMNKVIAQLGW